MILNGTEKSALLLMSIGANQAGEILKKLTPFEVQKLITSMVDLKRVSTEKLNEILAECYNLALKNNSVNCHDSDSYLIDMLTKALGEKKGNSFFREALNIRNAKTSIELLNYIKAEKLAYFLENEHPQIIATILIYLDTNQSSQVLSFFSDEKRAQIILRITEFNGIEESSLIELTKVIDNLLKNKKLILSEKGGIKTAAKLLKFMKIKYEKETIINIRKIDQKIADKIIKEMFLFKNIIDVEDKYIKVVIQNIEQEKLYIALQKTDYSVKEKFFKNMSEIESNKLSLSLEKKSYISDVSIKNEQKLILIMIKSIIENGNILSKNLREYYD
ncbi:flagellar motor switch protein FliG [Buchnera aphidicola (Hyperomyzus lactucae)]|uniref:Flagellar motor switch protein FliG n=1 Tax=Buchnera aphidicola (Hyperomyzus lactucae) TaxID=1241860 RepID=A0A4D6XXM4_9GAMM|nr:flagellar motor switch protein FliG [Buchnera aphidicola]QCI20817.1 flagellar motor switch protein FliG [Buchnera aphidicola (Hyperomyzus lactucae)]